MRSARHGSGGVKLSPQSAYVERCDDEPAWHDRLALELYGRVWLPMAQHLYSGRGPLRKVVRAVRAHDAHLQTMSDEVLKAAAQSLRRELRQEPSDPKLLAYSLALAGEAARRMLGLRPHDVQMMGAWALLQGRLTEMATGEGKTLTAALAVAAAALAGMPVHVVTVNDYLAERDARIMAPLYEFFGLRVGIVVNACSPAERRQAYACDITYCTNKELAFDYLKDRVTVTKAGGPIQMALDGLGEASEQGKLLLRGLHFAVVDEADSIFIDEARTPLILSASVGDDEAEHLVAAAMEHARALLPDAHFLVLTRERRIELTLEGQERADAFEHALGGVWASRRARRELIEQALSALHLYERDQHYVVLDGKVQIVDEFTGRILADRSWENGLHQMIEAKEGCALSARRVTLAKTSYQRLFRRYVRLAGMTGTASEVSGEIWSTYGLRTQIIPLRRASLRRHLPGHMLSTQDEKWALVVARVREVAVQQGRPVLVGTRSVEASEQVSRHLHEAGIPHVLLNAKQDKQEAQAIELAGQLGAVTVATNMAGRGTDIKLGDGVCDLGGLHVILTECHGSARIDRQLIGRGARQGDPGSCDMIASLQDEVLQMHAGPWLRTVGAVAARWPGAQAAALSLVRHLAQAHSHRQDVKVRRMMLSMDERMDRVLAFAGVRE